MLVQVYSFNFNLKFNIGDNMKIKCLFIIAVMILSGTALNAQVAVIVNKSVNASSISKSNLLDIYSLTTKNWDNGNKIIVFDQKSDNEVKEKFYSFIGKSNSDLKKVWMRAQLTGEGFAPEALNSDQEVLNKVASTPNAIGYINKNSVSSSVKVLIEIK